MDEQDKKIFSIIVKGVAVIFILISALLSFFIVNAGERGVVLRLGAINRIQSDGFHLKIPFIESVAILDVKTQKEQIGASAASKDLQNVTTQIALNYNVNPDKVGELWGKIGPNYKGRVVDPVIQESVKAVTANYTAEELVTKREIVKQEILSLLKGRLEKDFINVTDFSIVNFDFSVSFNQAIEAKVTAEQDALAAKNKLEQAKYEAEQRIAQARGEAEAIRIQAQAIQNQGGAEYVRLKTIEKWDGKLPVNLYGSAPIPFLDVK